MSACQRQHGSWRGRGSSCAGGFAQVTGKAVSPGTHRHHDGRGRDEGKNEAAHGFQTEAGPKCRTWAGDLRRSACSPRCCRARFKNLRSRNSAAACAAPTAARPGHAQLRTTRQSSLLAKCAFWGPVCALLWRLRHWRHAPLPPLPRIRHIVVPRIWPRFGCNCLSVGAPAACNPALRPSGGGFRRAGAHSAHSWTASRLWGCPRAARGSPGSSLARAGSLAQPPARPGRSPSTAATRGPLWARAVRQRAGRCPVCPCTPAPWLTCASGS